MFIAGKFSSVPTSSVLPTVLQQYIKEISTKMAYTVMGVLTSATLDSDSKKPFDPQTSTLASSALPGPIWSPGVSGLVNSNFEALSKHPYIGRLKNVTIMFKYHFRFLL